MPRPPSCADPAERAEIHRILTILRTCRRMATVYLDGRGALHCSMNHDGSGVIVGVYSDIPSAYQLAEDVRAARDVLKKRSTTPD